MYNIARFKVSKLVYFDALCYYRMKTLNIFTSTPTHGFTSYFTSTVNNFSFKYQIACENG